MADFADRAAELQQQEIAHSLAAVRDDDGLLCTGRCHNCEEEIAEPLRFCDEDCRDDWEKRARRRRGQRA